MKRWPLFAGRSCPRLNFQVDAAACLLGALALLLLPLKWLLAASLAAAFHECCHLLALRVCGGSCLAFTISGTGATIETEPMSTRKEVFCALAGPMGSFSLLLLAEWMPRVALCAAVQGMFNLLPVFPLDGGRIARGLFRIFLKNDNWKRAASVVEAASAVILGLAGIFCTVWLRLGYLPVMIGVFLAMRVFSRKIPCKESQQAVQ